MSSSILFFNIVLEECTNTVCMSSAAGSSHLLSRGQVVACAASRYEYEVFSGSVTEAASEALVSSQSALLAAARAVGAWRKPAVAAVHQLVVCAPGGQSRTFRFGTASADLPAQARCSSCPCLGFARPRAKSALPATARAESHLPLARARAVHGASQPSRLGVHEGSVPCQC